jgi:putative ABC transport system ATP-binding protein
MQQNNNNSLLELKNVGFKVITREEPILQDISFTVKNSDFIILLGSNGSGKSTLINLLNKHLQFSSGNIAFLGKSLRKYNNKYLTQKIVTLTQNTNDNLFTEMTVFENCMLFDRTSRRQQFAMFQDYLRSFYGQLADHMNTPVNRLSGGERQILALALCLRCQPSLVLLDEHTSALDPKTATLIMNKTYEIISRLQIACIMATHNLNFANSYGNRLLAIKNGRIIIDQDKNHISQHELLDICY